jgi:opacity protein-like surface antigen
LLAIVLFHPFSASAQDFPKYEVFGGFHYTRLGGNNWIGANASVAKNLSPILGIVADVGVFNSSYSQESNGDAFEQKMHSYSIMAGPQVTSRISGKLTPFIHLLLGAVHEKYELNESLAGQAYSDSSSDTEFAISFGGGVDYKLRGPLAVRGQFDYMGFRVPGGSGGQAFWNKGVRLSCGLSLRLGRAQ